jgi:hypothetical protein
MKILASSLVFATVSAAVIPSTAGAQQETPSTAQTRSPGNGQPDDIVVEGYRNRASPDSRVAPPAAVSAVRNRKAYEYSERIAKCAARSHLSSLARLSAVVDGEFNTATHLQAQDRLVRTYVTCSESPSLLSFTNPPRTADENASALQGNLVSSTGLAVGGPTAVVDGAPLGHSIYDRGAFTIQAIKMFAPDLRLTRQEVNDPVVQARFNAREVARNRFRLPIDYRYFEVAVCMVRVQPELAVRLTKSDGSARFSDVQEALIDRARVCIGGARHVSVDPTQFRMYIADAVYRWAVAARGIDSLIPAA